MKRNYKFMLLTFGVSVLIWLQINLLREQDTLINIPVQIINMPENLYLYPEVSIKMPVRVRGRGINILIFYFSDNYITCKAVNAVLGENSIETVSSDLTLPNIQNLSFFLLPTENNITFLTDRIQQKVVPIHFEFHSEKDRQTLIEDNFIFEDYFVTISGPSQLIQEINHVPSEKIGSEITKSTNHVVKINPTNAHIITVPQVIELQKVSDILITKTIIMIPIIYNKNKYSIFPDIVTVKVEGNQNIINGVTNTDILARIKDINYQDNDTTTLLFDVPLGVKVIDYTPNEVRVNIVISN